MGSVEKIKREIDVLTKFECEYRYRDNSALMEESPIINGKSLEDYREEVTKKIENIEKWIDQVLKRKDLKKQKKNIELIYSALDEYIKELSRKCGKIQKIYRYEETFTIHVGVEDRKHKLREYHPASNYRIVEMSKWLNEKSDKLFGYFKTVIEDEGYNFNSEGLILDPVIGIDSLKGKLETDLNKEQLGFLLYHFNSAGIIKYKHKTEAAEMIAHNVLQKRNRKQFSKDSIANNIRDDHAKRNREKVLKYCNKLVKNIELNL